VGFTKPTWEVGFTQLQQPHIDKYEASRAKGEVGPVMIFDIDEALPANTNRSTEMFTMTLTEFVKNMTRAADEPANCRTLKIAQAGEPPRGYLSHTAGLLVWAAACRRTLQVMSMANFKPFARAVFLGCRHCLFPSPHVMVVAPRHPLRPSPSIRMPPPPHPPRNQIDRMPARR